MFKKDLAASIFTLHHDPENFNLKINILNVSVISYLMCKGDQIKRRIRQVGTQHT